MSFFKTVARSMPELKLKLLQARVDQDPEAYLKRTFKTALFLSVSLVIIAFAIMKSPIVIVAFPILFLFSFFYFLRFVDVKMQKMSRSIGQEIIFAGRFMIIELESGVTLYDTFLNLTKNYEVLGSFCAEVVEQINLGTTMEDALNDAINRSPSPELRKILWQILNSMKTGADVADSLNAVIDQIVRQQQIDVKEYGRKLNPMAMFYMMMAVIVPSLGTMMLIVLATFMGFSMPLSILLIISGFIGFVQFMFYAMIKSQRPPMEL
jgi:archaeal flagellar protein FlaJ